MLVPYVYSFDQKHRRPPMQMKDLLGGKGANLAEMTSVLKLPVPPGFTISTDACRDYMVSGWPKSIDAEIKTQIAKLEKAMMLSLTVLLMLSFRRQDDAWSFDGPQELPLIIRPPCFGIQDLHHRVRCRPRFRHQLANRRPIHQ